MLLIYFLICSFILQYLFLYFFINLIKNNKLWFNCLDSVYTNTTKTGILLSPRFFSRLIIFTKPAKKISDVTLGTTAKNIVISPNFRVWKFCRSTQFPHSFGWIARNYAETAFPQNFHTRKLGEITVFFAVHLGNDITTCRI